MALDLSTKTGKHGGNILRPENKWVQTKNITTSRKIYFASAAENSISKFHEDHASTRMCERRSPEEREKVSSTLKCRKGMSSLGKAGNGRVSLSNLENP